MILENQGVPSSFEVIALLLWALRTGTERSHHKKQKVTEVTSTLFRI